MEKHLWFSKVWGALHVLYSTVRELSASPSNGNYFGSSKMNFMSSHTKEQQDKRLPDIWEMFTKILLQGYWILSVNTLVSAWHRCIWVIQYKFRSSLTKIIRSPFGCQFFFFLRRITYFNLVCVRTRSIGRALGMKERGVKFWKYLKPVGNSIGTAFGMEAHTCILIYMCLTLLGFTRLKQNYKFIFPGQISLK